MLMGPGENCGDPQGWGLRNENILDGGKMRGKVLLVQSSTRWHLMISELAYSEWTYSW
jgi:hypothetical protein